MITYEWNHDDLAYIEKKLGSMKGEARRALRDAVNKTAVSARKRLLQVAQERYTVKAGGFNSRADIAKATLASPTATIKIKGRTLTMPRYRITRPKSGVKEPRPISCVPYGTNIQEWKKLLRKYPKKVLNSFQNCLTNKRRSANMNKLSARENTFSRKQRPAGCSGIAN